jgi:uncharacterized protein (TIGR02001 family)
MNTPSRITLLGIILLFGAAGSHGQPAGSDPPLGVEIEAEVVSKYYWRGFNVTDDKPALQPGITLRHNPSGLWFNFWASLSLGNRPATRDTDEIDVTLALDRLLGETATLTAGVIFYRYPRLSTEENSTEEVFAGISFPEIPIQLRILYFQDFGLGDGGYFEVGGLHGIGDLSLAADLGIGASQYTGKKGFVDLVVGASYDVALGDSGFLSPFVRFAVVGDRDRNPDGTEFWFGVSVGWER